MVITGYNGSFVKKSGELRDMFFARPQDLSEDMLGDIFGTDVSEITSRKLPDGSELVFDLMEHDWRVFNKTTQVGELEPYEIDMPLFYGGDL